MYVYAFMYLCMYVFIYVYMHVCFVYGGCVLFVQHLHTDFSVYRYNAHVCFYSFMCIT